MTLCVTFALQLVPIRVGMILPYFLPEYLLSTCPHTRGDDPVLQLMDILREQLVPIRVGMILFLSGHLSFFGACPHTRGDDPDLCMFFGDYTILSPYAWG